MNPIFRAKISDQKLQILNRSMWRDHLKSFKPGMLVDVIVRKIRKGRSDEQNRFYWAVPVKILGDHFGYTKEEMHDACKWLFLKKEDGPILTVRSTTDLSTVEFKEYIEKIMHWASTEYDIFIPDPGEVEF